MHLPSKNGEKQEKEQLPGFSGDSKFECVDSSREHPANALQTGAPALAQPEQMRDLQIVVGRGKHSFGSSKLKDAVALVLRSKQINFEYSDNAGRLIIRGHVLKDYLNAEKEAEVQSQVFHTARMQQVVVILALSAALSAFYIIPTVLTHAV
jgi:hypothetical protein